MNLSCLLPTSLGKRSKTVHSIQLVPKSVVVKINNGDCFFIFDNFVNYCNYVFFMNYKSNVAYVTGCSVPCQVILKSRLIADDCQRQTCNLSTHYEWVIFPLFLFYFTFVLLFQILILTQSHTVANCSVLLKYSFCFF